MIRSLAVAVVLSLAAIPALCAPADEDKEIDKKAEQQSNAEVDSRMATIERLKAAGWKGPSGDARRAAHADAMKQTENPMFSKTDEELRAMGLKEKQIAEIHAAKARMPAQQKAIKAAGKLSDEAVEDPGSERIRKMNKARVKRKLVEERRAEELGEADADKAEKAEAKRKKAEALSQ